MENQANQPLLAPRSNNDSQTKKPIHLHRSRSSPARINNNILHHHHHHHQPNPNIITTKTMIVLLLFFFFYLSIGISVYFFSRNHYSGNGTDHHRFVDAFYFSVVTMCTIGYGDITPLTIPTKLFAVCFVLIGIALLEVLLTDVVDYLLGWLSRAILTGIVPESTARNRVKFSVRDCIVDVAKGKMEIWWKLCISINVVVLCICIGVLVLYKIEGLDLVDSVYLSVMSVTTVGYGDKAFKTFTGRLFAAFWLFASTLAVARAFYYFAEVRSDLRRRRALNRNFTVEDLLNADTTYRLGFISKSEFVVMKLREIGKVSDKDIKQIVKKFDKLDPKNLGKITLTQLLW